MLQRTLLWLLSAAVARAVDTLVELDYARYDGVQNDTGVTHWLGMRFAAPPVGDLRFAPPQDPEDTGDKVMSADEVGKRGDLGLRLGSNRGSTVRSAVQHPGSLTPTPLTRIACSLMSTPRRMLLRTISCRYM